MATVLPPNIRQREMPLEPNALVIHLGPLRQRMTDDDFFTLCQRNRNLRIEMTSKGDIIAMTPVGSEGGQRNFNLTVEFGIWAKTDGTGVGFDSSTGFTLPNGAKRSPDVSWIRRDRWNAIPKRQRKKFAPLCPDFVAELRSESDTLIVLQAKLEEYMANGAQLGWLLDPLEKKVYVYRPKAKAQVLRRPKTLSGEPLLTGFVLNLRGILY